MSKSIITQAGELIEWDGGIAWIPCECGRRVACKPARLMQARRKTKGGPTPEQAKAAGRKGAAKRWGGVE
jgi:hypothetical protein